MVQPKLKVEFQYFEGCPNYQIMMDNLKEAIKGLEDFIDVIYRLIKDQEDAVKYKFRGSPTLLINNEDLIGVESPVYPTLSCRYYPEGIPSPAFIREKIVARFSDDRESY
ncbi:MAG: DUF2703 domain-containing protein [Ignavibacteria bacterium]